MAFPSTFVDLQNAVIAKARLDATADLPRTKDWINQVYSQVCVENEVIVTSSNISLTAGTAGYDLSGQATIARIKGAFVTSGGVVYTPLKQVSLDAILKARQASGGVPTSQSTPEVYALAGYKTLEVYPTPAAADTLTIYAVNFPTALAADANVPVIQEPWGSKLLEYGALVEAADFKADPALERYEQKFAEWTMKFRTHLNLRKGLPTQAEFVDGRTYPPHDRATIL